MMWANDRLRINFFGAFKGETLLGKVMDERDSVDHGSDFEIKDNPALETVDLISFNKIAS